MRRQVKLAALRTHDCEPAPGLAEPTEPLWRPPPGLELEMPLPPCPPPIMPPSLPSLGSALHGSGDCQPCLDFWSKEGCPRDRECNKCHLCPSELKIQQQARMAGIVLQPIAPPMDQLEDAIDAPVQSDYPKVARSVAQPLDSMPCKGLEQLPRLLSDHNLNQRLERALDNMEDVSEESGTKPPSNERASALRLPPLRIHSAVALDNFPTQDLSAIQAAF